MSKINWLNFEINEKNYMKIFISGIVIIACYLAITFLSFSIPVIYHMDEKTVVDTEGKVKSSINNLYRGSLRLEIAGWAYKEGQAIESFNNYFILKNRETGKMYKIRTEMKEVPELQFVDGHEVLKCGMESQSIVMGLRDGEYDLYILYKNDGESLLVDTGVEVEL